MKKKIRTRSIKILSLILVLIVSIWGLQEFVLCHADHNRQRIKGFYLEDKNSIDVVLIGSSEIYAGYSACHAYEKFGFTSYSFSSQKSIVSNYKHQLKEVIKHQNPKLILIEVNGALYRNDKSFEEEANYRNYIDHTPLNLNKIEYINQNITDDTLEYYFPIIKYHSVWKDFPKKTGYHLSILEDRLRGYSYLKGSKNKTGVLEPTAKIYNESIRNDETRNDLSPLSEKYFIEFLEYCKTENIDNVVFVRFPHVIKKSSIPRYYRSNRLGDIIKEYGYDYINCEKYYAETGLDVEQDFYDIEHLNVYGQRKFTEYLGNIIQNQYGITKSELTPSQKEEWDESLEFYHAYCKYNEELIKKNECKEIGSDYKTIKKIQTYIE